MYNKILWTIDNGLDGGTFERLCVDLLYRNRYKDIIPIEPQDGGRDAEEFPRQGRGRAGEATFFQFSLEDDWKSKLRRDAQKLHERGYDFSIIVFVTSQKTRGVDVDALKKELYKKYGWKLVVYSREWLRLQLEEAYPDLAKKYLDVEVPNRSDHLSALVHFAQPTDERLSEACAALEAGAYERAAVEFRDFLKEQPEDAKAWQALSSCQYRVYRYDEALGSINRAIKLEQSLQAYSIRACILTEKGIKNEDKSSVEEARRLFEQTLELDQDPRWEIFYNLGNVLSALGEHEEAIHRYRQALKSEPNKPEILTNLASTYHLVGNHKAEMECLDMALELDPLKPEALVSKGLSLLVDFNEPEEAAALLERALKSDPDWAVQWPHVWYWLSEAYYMSGRLKQALHWVEEGLSHQLGHMGLRRLKSDLLHLLVSEESDLVEETRRFWSMQLSQEPRDYDTRSRLIRLEVQEGNTPAAWKFLDECFELMEVEPVVSLSSSGFDIEECVTALRFLPQYTVFRERYPISDYWRPEDPLYDLPFPPPSSNQIKVALTAYLAVPFGLGVKDLEDTSDSRENNEVLRHFFEVVRPHIEKVLIESSRQLADLIPDREEGVTVWADKLTEVMMFLGLVALREFGRQRGWIAGQFRISSLALNYALDRYDEAQIETNVVSKSVIKLNEKTGFASSSD